MDSLNLLLDQVREALARRQPLRIHGGDTKARLGRAVEGEPLDVSGHRGLVHYDPTELVATVRTGTPLAELNAALAEQGQMLPCEPPRLGEGATVGGTLACVCPGVSHQVDLDLREAAPSRFRLEPPGLLLHRWADEALVTHHLPLGNYPGPYPFFAADGQLLD